MAVAGPYVAERDGRIAYRGNRLFPPCEDVRSAYPPQRRWHDAATILRSQDYLRHLAIIDAQVFQSATDYLTNTAGARWASLPLTTKMISSPGAVYRGQQLDYSTDALPLEISDWFGSGERVFLSESSQLYLELLIAAVGFESVFSIYNSFRKEAADFSHLTEFQHIEFEGRCDFGTTKQIIVGLLDRILADLRDRCADSLGFFLLDGQLRMLDMPCSQNVVNLSFEEAMSFLEKSTGSVKYRDLSMVHFGAWEEIHLGNYLESHICIEGFPLHQVPFYHAEAPGRSDAPRARNADYILAGYREVVGAGERIADKTELLEKASIFNLPREDYFPYLVSRDLPDYRSTCGFGLGWQRLLQWVLNMPTIADATVFPRTHLLPSP